MKRKGFTLIELLAVIVILAIIALIATPIVLNMINSARKSAAKSAAYGYIEAIEYNNGFAELSTDAGISGYTKITTGDVSTINTALGTHIKGKKPDSGSVTVGTDGKVTQAEFCISGYTVTYAAPEITNVDKGCSGSSTPAVTYEVYNPGDDVYFDPVSNSKCTNGGTCYKWRVITVGDTTSNSDITLQMDHNLVLKDQWTNQLPPSSDVGPGYVLSTLSSLTSAWTIPGLTFEYDTSLSQYNYGKLSCEEGICTITKNNTTTQIATNVKARLITGEEVAAITKTKTPSLSWTLASNDSGWFWISCSESGTSSGVTGNTDLKWLVENTFQDSRSGATANTYGDANNGYWTLSPINNAQYYVWTVISAGVLSKDDTLNENSSYGFRPVITISKSVLD